MPNKTIYVSDDDLPIYGRAQELAGGNLSAAIARALRRFVDVEESRREGYQEFTVRVGPTPSKKIRFTGVPLGEWVSTVNGATEHVRVFGTRSGKYVIHTDRSAGFTMVDIPTERLGVRVSIVERVANAGGRAIIQSAPGEGTIVSIRWPHAAATHAPTFDERSEEHTSELQSLTNIV